MARAAVVAMFLVLGAVLPADAQIPVVPAQMIPRETVRSVLLRYGWTDEWATLAAHQVRAVYDAVPNGIAAKEGCEQDLAAPISRVTLGWGMETDPNHDLVLEHEFHHAYECLEGLEHRDTTVRDFGILAREVPEAAAILADPATRDDWGHYFLALGAALDRRYDRLPEWARIKWYGFAFIHRQRLRVPLARR